MRVFTGLPLPDSVREQVAGYIAALKQAAGGLKCVNPAGLHLTIHFFGECSHPEVEKICHLMDNSALRIKKIFTGIREAGQFPPRGNPRVIYLGLRGGIQELVACHKIFTGLVKQAGFSCPEEKKPFVPHLTVARNKGEMVSSRLLEPIPVPSASFMFDRLVLYKSVLTPGGAEYTALKTVSFF